MEKWANIRHNLEGAPVYYWVHGIEDAYLRLSQKKSADNLSNEEEVLLDILEAETFEERKTALKNYIAVETPTAIDLALVDLLLDPKNTKENVRAYFISRGMLMLHGN